ncbi:MAG: hypothetical protein DRP87_20010 [Spirochaetes bacterium]|nr:MAG: hypothetical protein DRP87_20010 [Spirochaetota bacterium]
MAVDNAGVLLAGSRAGEVPPEVCRSLLTGLSGLGLSFWVGCAGGVDYSFRKALAELKLHNRVFVGCAFPSRIRSPLLCGLPGNLVSPPGLHPKAALRRRTLYLVKRCCMAVLFPEHPVPGRWGKGSTLVFRSALNQLKPVFVVCTEKPKASLHYQVYASELFGVRGWWVIPHPIDESGLCDELY